MHIERKINHNTVALKKKKTQQKPPYSILVLNEEGGDDKGEGQQESGRRGSIFKTKDRLGDNEWCKPDDLLASAPLSRFHTWPRSFLLFSFSLLPSFPLRPSPFRPSGLIKTEIRLFFFGPTSFRFWCRHGWRRLKWSEITQSSYAELSRASNIIVIIIIPATYPVSKPLGDKGSVWRCKNSCWTAT